MINSALSRLPRKPFNTIRNVSVTASASVLLACGGGSGGGSTTTPPPPPPTNSAPIFTGASDFTFEENETVKFTLTFTDPDGDAVTISRNSSGDGAFFDVGSSTGNVVATVPDQAFNFEMPQDLNGDNVYEMNFTLSDGTISRSKTVSVTITDVDEAPQCRSNPTANFEENYTGSLFDFSDAAFDPEGVAAPTSFTLTNLFRERSPVDADTFQKFDLDSTTGILSLSQPLDAELLGVEDKFIVDVRVDFGAESVKCQQRLQLVDIIGVVNSGIKFSGRQYDATSLGDLDNDNLTDFWINSPDIVELNTTQPGGYVILGRTINAELSRDGAELIDLESLTASQAIRLYGTYSIPPNRGGAGNTFHLSSIGDLDGDGIGEIAIALEPSPATNIGDLDPDRPYGYILWGDVLLGQTDGEIDVSNLTSAEGLNLIGPEDLSRLSTTVGSGDFNADGISDLVLATPEARSGLSEDTDDGEIYIVFGTTLRAKKSSGELDLRTLNASEGVTFTAGNGIYFTPGLDARSIPDLFGDGADELVLATSGGGVVIDSDVIAMAAAASGVVKFPDIPDSKRVLINLQSDARLSAMSGDIDGDNLPDVLIQRDYTDGIFAAVVTGDVLVNNPPGDEIRFDGRQNDDDIIILAHSTARFTNAVSMTFIGDVDEDGRDDLGIIYQPGFEDGATYIILAKAFDSLGADNTFFIDQMSADDGVILSNYVPEYFDFRIAALEDSDGDNLPEVLIVGALDRTEGYLIPGSDIAAALVAGEAEIDIQANFNDESGN